jgi:hypothetical protein
MLRSIKFVLTLALLSGSLHSARAFSLLGIWDTWQTAALGYRKTIGGVDIGGPMNLSDGYRWNVPVITYAFDESFVHYFGLRGMQEVEKAIQILNNLPAISAMSSNLTEFPLDAARVNHQAQALGILDLKSTALALLVEEMGLAEPERYAWCLRDRVIRTINNVTTTNYVVIQRNFDPVTWMPSKFVNGTMYSYTIDDPVSVVDNSADAVEFVADPLALSYTAVARSMPYSGQFFTGITRDDAGGLRYLYRHNNYNVENLPAGVSNSLGGGIEGNYVMIFPTNTVLGTNGFGSTGSNTLITVGVRPGIDKIQFQRVEYDSYFSQTLVPYYYDYTDTVITNFTATQQFLRRTITQPDILFTAEDLGMLLSNGGLGTPYPVLTARTAGFVSNDAINGNTTKAGPGVIQAPITISFTYLLPAYLNDNQFFDEATATKTSVWGSFDGGTNAPVVYPSMISIQDIERLVQSGR